MLPNVFTGTVRGGTQLQIFHSVGLHTSAYNNSLLLPHDTQLYVTVIATNGADVTTAGYSDSVTVDRTPPTFEHIYDGQGMGTHSVTLHMLQI